MLSGAEAASVPAVAKSAFELLDLLPPTEQRRLGFRQGESRKKGGRLAALGLLGAGDDAGAPLALGDGVADQADAVFDQVDAAFDQAPHRHRKRWSTKLRTTNSHSLAKKQIRAQGLWMKRNGGTRTQDFSMVEAIDKTMGLAPMRRRHRGKGDVGGRQVEDVYGRGHLQDRIREFAQQF